MGPASIKNQILSLSQNDSDELATSEVINHQIQMGTSKAVSINMASTACSGVRLCITPYTLKEQARTKETQGMLPSIIT